MKQKYNRIPEFPLEASSEFLDHRINRMHASDLPVCIVQIVVKYSPSSLRCKRINSAKTSDLFKDNSVLLKVFSVLPVVILKVLKDH